MAGRRVGRQAHWQAGALKTGALKAGADGCVAQEWDGWMDLNGMQWLFILALGDGPMVMVVL